MLSVELTLDNESNVRLQFAQFSAGSVGSYQTYGRNDRKKNNRSVTRLNWEPRQVWSVENEWSGRYSLGHIPVTFEYRGVKLCEICL